ncbi:TonB-dependent receptor [Arcicella sp. LKC2W]|uniref:SusC/RagA family TonB-linked outer membrane protein n=1 Tax=Arcicella sp. LKC2W TaxID=2984198 RepID=UPI002B203F0B|nr:TonB-dependent receptor [Arcicella sp. LKC2W]MEA5460129.1 TonB-dependent receptor [Arcicella sp. LKC2W]
MNTKFYSPLKSMLLLGVFLLSTLLTLAQDRRVTGKVTGADGQGIPGVSILLKGTQTGTTTDVGGNFAIGLKSGKDVLVFSAIGYKASEVSVGSQTSVNVTLNDDVSALDEVVVTGYQTVRKRDITGAVTVIETEGLKSVKGASFTQNLAGRAPGVTISTSGSPGDATNVRVRGIGSFTSNDPLYVIDGVPVQDQYQNTINPDDIESIQVLKDASTSSIYGSRASNGVIVITTKQGKSGKTKITYNASFGLANSVKGYDDILNLNTTDYAKAMKLKFPGETTAWFSNPGSYPKYIHKPDQTLGNPALYDEYTNRISETNTVGTNWWKEVSRTAQIHDHNVSFSGGNDFATFSLTGSYLTQQGVLNHTDYNRATIRANSTFKVSKKFRVGENLMYATNWGVSTNSAGGGNNEQGVIGNLLKATPVVPVFDIKGNPSMHRSNLTGNFTNPDDILRLNKDNTNRYNRLLGNIYAEADVLKGLTLRSSFGVDFGNGYNQRFSITANPASTESVPTPTSNAFGEGWNQSFTYTWTNTANYSKDFGPKHHIGVLIGQEAIAGTNRTITGGLSSYFTTDVNAWYLNTAFGDPTSRQVSSFGSEAKLASIFGKFDYSYDDKYLFSATIRRDGSSKFLSDVRYGVFPAVSLGWRVSREGFMKELPWISDLKLRASYGEVGNQNIRNYNFANLYGGSVGGTFYDINGTNGGVATGYALTSRGNASTIWETAKTSNFGVDAAFLNNQLTFVLDIYKRNTENLLYNPALPGTAGAAAAPFVNIGAMTNTGYDIAVNYRKTVNKDVSFNVGLNLSHYKNTINQVSNNDDHFIPSDGLDGRLDIPAYDNKVGYSISSFRGFIVDGLITTEAEKTNGYVGSAIGGLKFKDLNGDNKITDADRTIIGSPHPTFTGGLNIGVNYKSFDLTAFMFGSFGNDIFNYTKMFSYFMNFNSNIGKDVLAVQGTGNNPKINGLDVASRASSTFYIENGSYVRLANLQLGYRVPKDIAAKLGVAGARLYVQGQNLLTFTGYSGVDPAVSSANIGGSSVAGNASVNDSGKMGFDAGHYPANKITTIGLSVEF